MRVDALAGSCGRCGRRGPRDGYRREPAGYVAWHEWAERIGRTHEQLPCPGCGRLTVWRRRAAPCR